VQPPPPSGVSALAGSTVPEHARHSRTPKQAMRVIVVGMSCRIRSDKVHIVAIAGITVIFR
jgi:hypothetical protein